MPSLIVMILHYWAIYFLFFSYYMCPLFCGNIAAALQFPQNPNVIAFRAKKSDFSMTYKSLLRPLLWLLYLLFAASQHHRDLSCHCVSIKFRKILVSEDTSHLLCNVILKISQHIWLQKFFFEIRRAASNSSMEIIHWMVPTFTSVQCCANYRKRVRRI